MNKAPDQHDVHRAAVRAKGFRLTPFRIGLAVGEAGLYLPAPAAYATVAAQTYTDGVKAGHRTRESRLRQQIEDAQRQVQQQYRTFTPRMAAECMAWHLHQIPGTLQFTLLREDAVMDVPLPRVIENVEALTEDRLLIRLARVIGGR